MLLLVAFVAMAQDTKQMPSHEQLTELFKMYDQMQSELDSTGQNPSMNLFMSIVGSGKDINERTQAMRQKLRERLGDKSVILDEYINSLAEANDSTDVHAFTQLTLKMVDCMKKVQSSPQWDVLKEAISSSYQFSQYLKSKE